MGYLWDRYGFVRRYRYLWQKERVEAVRRHYQTQGAGQIGAVKGAIDMQKLVNQLNKLRQNKATDPASEPLTPAKASPKGQ
jgi:hypothetical protein